MTLHLSRYSNQSSSISLKCHLFSQENFSFQIKSTFQTKKNRSISMDYREEENPNTIDGYHGI